jgi:hypothetical protein
MLAIGMAEVFVPLDAPIGNNSIVALVGDSGDISPEFTIVPSYIP